ncbi:DUF2251 domain-containing protein [Aquabacterium lacunae]|uniref:DUF2251 domain-containing protein n=2 Tax=Aquabacterium lacunae TaxID=2528630 RepID=A0A4V2JF97_9BURK|nr:DUF2251 domain-containing protein [Aquabacterium lacunae]
MPIQVTAEQELIVGESTVVAGDAPESPFVAVFEDDGQTGYFYALDTSIDGQQIQDAMHIYNVADVADRAKPSTIKIGWSTDSHKTVLLINGYPHAVFDFEARRGYCRTGFPPAPSNGTWSTSGHAWDESCIALFS